jgi:hypothetical protein
MSAGKHQVMPTNTGFTLTNVSDGRCLRIVNRQMIYSCRMRPSSAFRQLFVMGLRSPLGGMPVGLRIGRCVGPSEMC